MSTLKTELKIGVLYDHMPCLSVDIIDSPNSKTPVLNNLLFISYPYIMLLPQMLTLFLNCFLREFEYVSLSFYMS